MYRWVGKVGPALAKLKWFVYFPKNAQPSRAHAKRLLIPQPKAVGITRVCIRLRERLCYLDRGIYDQARRSRLSDATGRDNMKALH